MPETLYQNHVFFALRPRFSFQLIRMFWNILIWTNFTLTTEILRSHKLNYAAPQSTLTQRHYFLEWYVYSFKSILFIFYLILVDLIKSSCTQIRHILYIQKLCSILYINVIEIQFLTNILTFHTFVLFVKYVDLKGKALVWILTW